MSAAGQSIPEPPLEIAEDSQPAEDHGLIERADWCRLAVVGVASALSWFHATPLAGRVDPVAAAWIGGYPVFHEAFENFAPWRGKTGR
jgi:hypothetical protein